MGNELTGLQVYKFGGASVKDAAAILNLCRIVRDFGPKGPLLIVVSAMGKTTNALEEIFDLAYYGQDYSAQLAALEAYHQQAHIELQEQLVEYRENLDESESPMMPFATLKKALAQVLPNADYDEGYDQIISYGELLSANIVANALAYYNLDRPVHWYPTSGLIQTDLTWREARVDWVTTEQNVCSTADTFFRADNNLFHTGRNAIIVTQGFVGGTTDGRTTTLGREGSDYTAAILAYCLRAESVTIWKDVPGLLNADPKIFADTVLYPEISYQETIEMAFYGASVIHPKTLKPLAERGIPLRVKSFLDPAAPGTLIHDCQHAPLVPAFIRKAGQGLLSFESKDFAFISEENLEVIFGALAQARLKINLMQNSAISFSVCVDYSAMRVQRLLELLGGQFRIQYNADLTLFTIKHYDQASVERLTGGRVLLLEQRTRSTFQFLVRE
ncbi:aspartate kinase [Hymenobacter sp. H14-R3]|uniref:aspartate kinase n=1 Tax=Hymenobacter sp. H14-R3 TaxID=3046308 RepID=UPI0024B92EC7|nr:aspartate kinase [Hymenobacter sp. H14-R3]MDJ0365952.1 aspartate kinase [Hymenobacter sp. H14-R3]